MLSLRYILNRIRRLTPVLFMSFFIKKRKHNSVPRNPESIIIMSQDKLGDLILLTPLLKTWKRHFPHSKLSVAVTRYNLSIAEKLTEPDEVFVLKNNPRKLKELRKSKGFDILYNPKDHCSRSQMLWSALIPAKYKIGFKAFLTEKFYDHVFSFNEDANVIEKNMQIFSLLGKKVIEDDLLPQLPKADDSQSRIFLKDKKGKLIGLNFSAGDPERQYFPEKWEEIISSFSGSNVCFILFGINEMQDITRRIAKKYAHAFRPEGIKDLLEMNSYIAKLDLLITPDTSVYHLGYAAKVRTIGLFQNRRLNMNRFAYQVPWVKNVISADSEVASIKTTQIIDAVKDILSF